MEQSTDPSPKAGIALVDLSIIVGLLSLIAIPIVVYIGKTNALKKQNTPFVFGEYNGEDIRNTEENKVYYSNFVPM